MSRPTLQLSPDNSNPRYLVVKVTVVLCIVFVAFDGRRTQPKLDAGRSLGTSIMRKETRFLDVKAGGQVRYRTRKYVIDLDGQRMTSLSRPKAPGL